MIEKKDVLKMVRHVLKRSRGIPDKRLLHPVREWLVGLFGSVAVVVVGVIYVTHLFGTYSTIAETSETEPVVPVRYNQALIDEARALYQTKRDTFSALRGVRVAAPPADVTDAVASSTETAEEEHEASDSTPALFAE